MQSKLYHMGFRGKVSRSTLADANERRDWRIYADFAQVLTESNQDECKIKIVALVVWWGLIREDVPTH